MKRPALLTQVLAVNALLIAATVLAATVAVHLDPDAVADRRRLALLVAAVLATVLANGLILRRRFAGCRTSPATRVRAVSGSPPSPRTATWSSASTTTAPAST